MTKRIVAFVLTALFLVASSLLMPLKAQTDSTIPKLEPITIENAAKLEQIEGLLTAPDGFSVSPDGQQVAVAYPDGVRIYAFSYFVEPTAILEIASDPLIQKIRNPVFSPNGKLLAVDMLNEFRSSTVQIWDITAKTILRKFETDPWPLAEPVQFSPDGTLLAGEDVGGSERIIGLVYIWDVAGERNIYNYDRSARYGITDSTFTPDSKTVVYGVYEAGEVFWQSENLVTGELDSFPLSSLKDAFDDGVGPFGREITTLSFSPDGSIMAATHCTWIYDCEEVGTVTHLWDVATGKEIVTLAEGIIFHAFTPTNDLLLTDPNADALVIFKFNTNAQTTLIPYDGQEWQPKLWANGTIISLQNEEGTVQFWGVPTP